MKIELLFTSLKDDEQEFLKTLNEYANLVKIKIASKISRYNVIA